MPLDRISGPARLQMLDDGANWILLETITYTDSAGRVWTAPAGMQTDLASIPQSLWTAVGSPATGLYRLAAIFHDAAYRVEGMDKAAADDMLYELSVYCGCDPALAGIIREGVRLGGGWAFEEDQEAAREGKECDGG